MSGREEGVVSGCEEGVVSEWQPGSALPALTVLPDRYVTVRYAGASGDFNPIHIDDELARSVGLPGRILHGLYSMAQVARALTAAAGGPHHLRSLSVQFRAPAVPEQALVVTATVRELQEGVAIVDAVVRQGDKRVIRNARAELVLG